MLVADWAFTLAGFSDHWLGSALLFGSPFSRAPGGLTVLAEAVGLGW
ncbi:hypothetical protein [Actinosynnema pretiosum]|nr:hypothetical protein [Actinosynnema pretiosum]